MLRKSNLCSVNRNIFVFIRNLTATEVSTALRPFYFSVHPDLFGQHPKERAVNETSLQQLSSVLQSLQSSKYLHPLTLSFYVKNRNQQNEAVRLIRIYLKDKDIGATIINILKSCDLPTSHLQHYLNNSAQLKSKTSGDDDPYIKMRYKNEFDFTKMDQNHPIFGTFAMRQKIKEVKENVRLKNWLQHNFKDALKKCKSGFASREEIKRLKEEMIEHSGLKDIRWDCGWNSTHFRGCLLSLKSLMDQHPQHMKNLEDHVLIFSYFTGISLDGHIMLFSGEVRHNWLDFIKNITKHEAALKRVPFYEKSLTHVLRNIQVGRRKFMQEVKVGEYEKNLKNLTTAVSDFLGCNRYPTGWPKTLEKYEIVVESEAGPLMVSPTGQFIVPSSIPETYSQANILLQLILAESSTSTSELEKQDLDIPNVASTHSFTDEIIQNSENSASEKYANNDSQSLQKKRKLSKKWTKFNKNDNDEYSSGSEDQKSPPAKNIFKKVNTVINFSSSSDEDLLQENNNLKYKQNQSKNNDLAEKRTLETFNEMQVSTHSSKRFKSPAHNSSESPFTATTIRGCSTSSIGSSIDLASNTQSLNQWQQNVLQDLARIKMVQEQQSTLLTQIWQTLQVKNVQALQCPPNVPDFPVGRKRDFATMEEWLETPHNFIYMRTRLASIGGSTIRNAVMNMLKFVISNKVGMAFNWAGSAPKSPGLKKKHSFKETLIYKALNGRLLIGFISSNLQEADRKIEDYKRDKVTERSLHNRCIAELELASLIKDDNIYPEIMIKCCRKLLENKSELKSFTKELHLNVSTYYSVLSDGVVCIPWNFVI